MENRRCSICDHDCGLIHDGNLCYNEDKILIYNINVYVPGCIEQAILPEYFLKFGKIDEVRVLRKFSSYRGDVWHRDYLATIRFHDAESATKALTERAQMLKIFRTTKSESWHQPDYKPGYLYMKIDESKIKKKKNYLLTEINEDCLFYICKKLQLNEHIKLFELSEKFQKNFESIYRHEKSLFIDENSLNNLTILQIREAIEKIGLYLQKFEITNKNLTISKKLTTTTTTTTASTATSSTSIINNKNNEYLMDFVMEFCKNLQIIKIQSINCLDENIWENLTDNLPNLIIIELKNSNIDDKIIKHLTNNQKICKQIRKFDLSLNVLLTGQYLNKLPELIELNLSHCDAIEPDNFINLCEISKNLQILNISNCILLNTFALRKMSIYCKNLENLSMTTNYETNNLEIILELKNLKFISISESYSHIETFYSLGSLRLGYFIEQLAAKKSQKLEIFKLYTDKNLDKNGLGAILSLKQLNELHLEGCCYHRYFWLAVAKLNNLKILNLHGNFNFYQPECYNFLAKAKNLDKVYLRWGSPDKLTVLKTITSIKRQDDQKALYLKIRVKNNIRDEILQDPDYLTNKRHVYLDFFDETDNFNYLEYPYNGN